MFEHIEKAIEMTENLNCLVQHTEYFEYIEYIEYIEKMIHV